jgi:hypothetical protein
MPTGGGLQRVGPSGVRRALLVGAVLSLIAMTLSACGSSSDEPTAKVAPDNLISHAEVEKQPAGSAQAAFLEFWSALQFQSWAEMIVYYSPDFRESVGTAQIIAGKKVNASSYPQLKPTIVDVKTKNGLTTINYTVQFIDGSRELASISWRKRLGNWEIVFDSRLEPELAQAAENEVELETNGVLPSDLSAVSPEAAKASGKAGQDQPKAIEAELESEKPGP